MRTPPLTALIFGLIVPALAIVAEPQLLAHWPFDEGEGGTAWDVAEKRLDADFDPGIQWVKGPFGTAVAFPGKGEQILLPPIPELDGRDRFSLALWAAWEAKGRQYPNLLTCEGWCPNGLMLFMDKGALSFRLGLKDPAWTETGILMIPAVETNRWRHLCITFNRPDLAAYVDGTCVGRTRWDHPLAVKGIRLGGWHSAETHKGLMDDLRFYGEALSPESIAQLAADPRYREVGYAPIPPRTVRYLVIFTGENRDVTLAIDRHGRIASLRERASGRELIGQPLPMVKATFRDGSRLAACEALPSGEPNRLRWLFPRQAGSVDLSITPFDGGWTFRVEALQIPDATRLTFCTLAPQCDTWRGVMANLVSDPDSGVALRAYDLRSEMAVERGILSVTADLAHGLTGWRAGLCAGPRAALPGQLRAMAKEAGVPTTRIGGPWVTDAPEARGSYLFADLSRASTEDWIALALRGGFSTIHIHGWWEKLGHYPINTRLFPKGIDDMRETVSQIHAAGLRAGIHTLTACIDPTDAWITPECSTNLLAWASYTLAEPLTADGTVITVREQPIASHDRVFTYSGNGNAIRIGTEVIQYTDIRREAPYAFTDCTRGAFGTRPTPHAAGERADYLQQRYYAFYPDPDAPIADALATRIAEVFNTCGCDQIYFDGSEGMMSRYGIDAMRHKIFAKLDPDRHAVLDESSCHGAHNWWFHSRIGAWDHPVWGAKRFHDRHIRETTRASRLENLLEPQLGWWAPRQATPAARGHFLDEMEYFAAKNAALDAAMSIQGINVTYAPLPFGIERQITVMGWYERFRLARAFAEGVRDRLGEPGAEFRLRQGDDGIWRFTPVTGMVHRVSGPAATAWSLTLPAETPADLRIEALYSAAPYRSDEALPILTAGQLASLSRETAQPVRLEAATADDPEHGPVIRIRATNTGTEREGSWCCLKRSIPHPYLNIDGTGAFGLWVKGDGSGALLNLQLTVPREHLSAISDHYLRIDFTGWRYVELLARERDAAESENHRWPYGWLYDVYRDLLDLRHISGVNLYLNEIPPGGATEIAVAEVQALRVQSVTLDTLSVRLNGTDHPLPFPLVSGEYAELTDGRWIRYSEKGEVLARTESADRLLLAAGKNAVSLALHAAKATPRAEVTLFGLGTPFPALKEPLSDEQLTALAYEAMEPATYAPAIGCETLPSLLIRPGERAQVAFTCLGPLSPFTLAIGSETRRFPAAIGAGETLTCETDGSWRIVDAKRKIRDQGKLEAPFPAFSRSQPMRMTPDDPANAHARFDLIKWYRR
ncbi:MAG: LamG domain-containing protein [Kiritimatiellae bacterium]|nr:LamG domain-containing protein [Kiritimatiellia bacterium]